MQATLEKGPENLKLDDCIRSTADIFCNLDVRSVNHGFKKDWVIEISVRTSNRNSVDPRRRHKLNYVL